jgi:hypothetical protein
MQHGTPLGAERSRQDSTRPGDRLAIGSALLGGLIVAALLIGRTLFSGSQSSPETLGVTSTPQPTHVLPDALASVPASSPVAANPVGPGRSAVTRAQIAHTDGQGVVLRASPREDDRTPRGFMDGDSVTVLERQGSDWARVRGDNSQEGWIPARYLGP